MIRWLLLSVLALLFGAVLLWLLRQDSGYVLIVAWGKTIEMRLSFAIVILLMLLFLMRAVAWMLSQSFGLFSSWKALRRPTSAPARTLAGLRHYVEGDWLSAKKMLVKAAKRSDQPVLQYLAAAHSAFALGDREGARVLMAKAEAAAPANDLSLGLGLARLLFMDAEYDRCLATLHHYKTMAPEHPVILELLYRVYGQLGHWSALQNLLPTLDKRKILPEPERAQAWTRCFAEQVHNLIQSWSSASELAGQTQRVEQVRQTWQSLPKSVRQTEAVIFHHAEGLAAAGDVDAAERLLRDALKQQWSPVLISAYGRLKGLGKRQMQFSQSLLPQYPREPSLRLALGRIAQRLGLWGLARDHLQASLELQPTAEVYAELAQLFARLGERDRSADFLQRGLALSLTAKASPEGVGQ